MSKRAESKQFRPTEVLVVVLVGIFADVVGSTLVVEVFC